MIAGEEDGTLHVAVSLGDNGRHVCCRQVLLRGAAEICFKLNVMSESMIIP